MTDPKRITLPGPGSQPANPAPEPAADSIATAVLGALPSSAPPAERAPELLDADEDESAPGFNPFKFQRITVPPGLRADIIRWSRESKRERPPEDTLPPRQRAEADLDSESAESDGDDPGSMMPVGHSAEPKLPLRSMRNFALAIGLVLLPLAVLGVVTTMRQQVDTSGNAPHAAPRDTDASPRAASKTPPAIQTSGPAPVATVPANTAEDPPASNALTTAAPRVRPRQRPDTSSTKRSIAPASPVVPAPEPKSPETTGENALDRPFSLPK